MSVVARQRRELAAIESALRASDPRLAVMFAIFARLHQVDGPVTRELLSRPRLRVVMNLRQFVLVLAAVAMLAGGVALGIMGHMPSTACEAGHGGHHTVVTGRLSYVANCAQPPHR
jgi:anti-sigma-K factor RskA